jgi:esterase/lipase superfamily enzyme/Tfp pilus assembly protein PilF
MIKLLHCVAGFVVLAVIISLSAPSAAETNGEAALDARVEELYRMGKNSEAIPLAERALAVHENAVGPDHPDVARSLNNLAALYQNQGRYADAEPLYMRALAIREKTLGPDHPDVAITLNNLAALYQIEGRYEEVQALYQRALAIREKTLGPDDPTVATTLNNLAALYQNQGRYADAEPLYMRALAIREKTLGPDHPDVAQSLNNLAALYQNQGRYADAEPLYMRALAIYDHVLGPDHIEVSWSLTNLANLYEEQGRFTDAEPLDKRALAIRDKALGPDQRPPPPPPPIGDPRLVEFLFASTRQEIAATPGNTVSYSGERGPLTFGAASVRIPPDHKIGHIERPSSWSLFGITLSSTPNEREHFVVKQVVSLSENGFDQVVRGKGAKTALVFVHGFNTTFEDALYRNAQIAWDLQYSGLSVLFTWASRGRVADYIYDRESAYLAREAFIALLEKLKRDYGIEQVNVLAHSMGNLIAVDALANYARTSNPVKIAHLVMAAPDVDRNQFLALVPVARAIVGGMTIYASSADRALVASRKLAGGVPRAGDVPADGPIILPNVETIDVTAMGEDIFGLNHSVFAASRDVMEDISALLRLNLPPPRLIQIRPVPDPPAATRYWRYVR